MSKAGKANFSAYDIRGLIAGSGLSVGQNENVK